MKGKCRRCEMERRLIDALDPLDSGYCEECFTEVVIGETPNDAPETRYDLSEDV